MSKGVQIHGRVEEGGGAAWRRVANGFFSPRRARATAGEEGWNFARTNAVKITGRQNDCPKLRARVSRYIEIT